MPLPHLLYVGLVVVGTLLRFDFPVRTVSKDPDCCGERQDGCGEEAKFDKHVVKLLGVRCDPSAGAGFPAANTGNLPSSDRGAAWHRAGRYRAPATGELISWDAPHVYPGYRVLDIPPPALRPFGSKPKSWYHFRTN